MVSTPRQFYDQALQIAGGLGSNFDVSDPETKKRLETMASYLKLAIESSKEPFPDAHARLSSVLLLLGKKQEAKMQAQKAVLLKPYSFRARLTIYGLTVTELEEYRPVILTSSIGAAVVSVGISAAILAGKKGRVREAARELANAFIKTAKQDFLAENDIDVESYIEMSQTLLDIEDYLRYVGIKEESLHKVILQIPWEFANLSGFQDIVVDIRARAERNRLL